MNINWIFFIERDPASILAVKVVTSIKEKMPQEEIQAFLKDVSEEDRDGQNNALRVSVFTETLLHLASKSFSHSFAAIAKFHPTLKVRGAKNNLNHFRIYAKQTVKPVAGSISGSFLIYS